MRLAEAEDGEIGQRPKKNGITGKRKSRSEKEMEWEDLGE